MNPNKPYDQFVEHMDMAGVDGVSCEIVHPLLIDFCDGSYGDASLNSMVTILQRQIRACFLTHTIPMFMNVMTAVEPIDSGEETKWADTEYLITINQLGAFMTYAMSMAWGLDKHISEKLG